MSGNKKTKYYNKSFILKILFFFLSLLFSFGLFAQTIITGTLKDEKDSVISFANIFVKPTNVDSIIAFSTANEKGKYILNINRIGNFDIHFSSLSYETAIISISISSFNQLIEKNVLLQSKPYLLNEVILKTELPIVVKKDTIIYNVRSFLRGNEQVVEDLLKKLPGLTVENDGTIKFGNEEVEKRMVEGNDFFENGYKILSKNMPSSLISKVELLQHYSSNKHLKGIENSDKVALNLKVDENVKRKWFGNLNLGYAFASETRLDNGFNLMNFGKKTQYYFLGNSNNLGHNATGDISQLVKPSRTNEQSNLGDNQGASELVVVNDNLPSIGENRTNLNNDNLLSLNAIFNPSSKIKIKALGFFDNSIHDFYNSSFESFSFGGSQFNNFESSYLNKNKVTGLGKLDLNYNLSPTKTIEYSFKINNAIDKYNNKMLFNGNSINEQLQNNGKLIDQKFVYTNRYKKKRVFILSARFINEEIPQTYYLNQFIYADLFPTAISANNLLQKSKNEMQFAGIEAHIMDRKVNGNLFEFLIGNCKLPLSSASKN